uniref:Integrase core domain containing protein n=1 Tax=Solanum tuberosum TaxID=4113 RepID=M1E032_SOLTU
MSVNGSNGSQVGHQDDIENFNDVNDPDINDLIPLGNVGVIRLPPTEGTIVLHITSTVLQLLQLKCLFGGLAHEGLHEHIRNFVDVEKRRVLENRQFGKPKVQSTTHRRGRRSILGLLLDPPSLKWKAGPFGKPNFARLSYSATGSASFSEPEDDQLLQARRAEIHANARHDPSRIPEVTSQAAESVPAPAQTVVLVPPVQGPPPRLLNRLKDEELRTILEEK